MKTHYPTNYTKHQLKKASQTITDSGNALCGAGNRGVFRGSVTVSLDINDIDCKRCLKLLGVEK